MDAITKTSLELVKMRANRKATETACTSCGRGFELAEEIYSCPACGGYHHAACWEANRTCSPANLTQQEPAAPFPEALTGSVHCPKCGLINPATAVICDCGYAFPTRLDAQPQLVSEDEQVCRFCGELIKKEALKCRHCGSVLDDRLADLVANPDRVKPPPLHWVAVLILACATLGLFAWIWLLVQTRWAKKADPFDNSTWLVGMGIFLYFIGVYAQMVSPGNPLWTLAGIVCFQLGNFKVKKAMENYYGSVEPVHLRLSGVMTFFFSMIYFQYHFHRIAKKREAAKLKLDQSQVTVTPAASAALPQLAESSSEGLSLKEQAGKLRRGENL